MTTKPADTAEITTAIAEYSPFAAGLAELRQRFSSLVFDCRTAVGDREARKARLELVKLRGRLEDKRKEIKAPALERSRLIDADARRIELAIRELERPIDEQIAVVEKEKAEAKERKQREDAARIAAVRKWIVTAYQWAAQQARGKSVEEVQAAIASVAAAPLDPEHLGDLLEEAKASRTEALQMLAEELQLAMTRAEQQAEIERQRAELAEQRRKDAEAKAEQTKRETAERAEAERLRREQQAAEDAERARIDAERQADLDRRAAALREQTEAFERQQSQQRERDAAAAAAAEAEAKQARERHAAEMAARAAELEEQSRLARERQERIAAAAPRMLDALRAVRDSQAFSAMDVEPRDAVLDAIAEAEGPAS